jgi:hypothetical protein
MSKDEVRAKIENIGILPSVRVALEEHARFAADPLIWPQYCKELEATSQVVDYKYTWRRERDSNPRYPYGHNGFQDRRFQPLTHPSALESLAYWMSLS